MYLFVIQTGLERVREQIPVAAASCLFAVVVFVYCWLSLVVRHSPYLNSAGETPAPGDDLGSPKTRLGFLPGAIFGRFRLPFCAHFVYIFLFISCLFSYGFCVAFLVFWESLFGKQKLNYFGIKKRVQNRFFFFSRCSGGRV